MALGSFDGSNGVEPGTGFDADDWFAHYVDYSGDLANPDAFDQPGARISL